MNIDSALLQPQASATELLALIIRQNEKMCAISATLTTGELTQPQISGWSVAKHLEHLCYTGKTGVYLLLQALDGNQQDAVPLHELGQRLLTRGSFPRYETTSPDFAQPRGMSPKKLNSSLTRILSQVQDLLPRCDEMNRSTTTSAHPILGGFTPRIWLQFMALHQNHHLEISEEIRAVDHHD